MNELNFIAFFYFIVLPFLGILFLAIGVLIYIILPFEIEFSDDIGWSFISVVVLWILIGVIAIMLSILFGTVNCFAKKTPNCKVNEVMIVNPTDR